VVRAAKHRRTLSRHELSRWTSQYWPAMPTNGSGFAPVMADELATVNIVCLTQSNRFEISKKDLRFCALKFAFHLRILMVRPVRGLT
jgi:hypothetical protein